MDCTSELAIDSPMSSPPHLAILCVGRVIARDQSSPNMANCVSRRMSASVRLCRSLSFVSASNRTCGRKRRSNQQGKIFWKTRKQNRGNHGTGGERALTREALSTPHVKDRLPCEQGQEDLPGVALGGYPGNLGRSGFM